MNANRDTGNAITAVFAFGSIHVAEGIDPRGNTVFAILGDPDGIHGSADAKYAPHEQLGPLPAAWQELVDLTPADRHVSRVLAQVDDGRCTGIRKDGQPCRAHRVRGSLCSAHERQQADAGRTR
ncbi:hypothetical protein [Microbacterium xylanilyticum]